MGVKGDDEQRDARTANVAGGALERLSPAPGEVKPGSPSGREAGQLRRVRRKQAGRRPPHDNGRGMPLWRPCAPSKGFLFRAAAIVAVLLLLIAAGAGCAAPAPLLSGVSVTPGEIRPGAASGLAGPSAATVTPPPALWQATPGQAPPPAAHIAYTLGRAASVAIYLIGPDGQQHVYRPPRQSTAGAYTLDWGGVVNEPLLRAVPGGEETLQSWVLPQGSYRWVVEATDGAGGTARDEGPITVDVVRPTHRGAAFHRSAARFQPKTGRAARQSRLRDLLPEPAGEPGGSLPA